MTNKIHSRPLDGIFGCAAPAWLWHTHSAMATKASDKEEEQCCHCNQPNLTIRFLNDDSLIILVYIHLRSGYIQREVSRREYKLCLLLLLCASAIGYNSVGKQSQQSVMSCRCSKVTLEIGGRYFRCLL